MEYIPRLDQHGRNLSVDNPPRRRSVLFTGGAGSGKSTELDRAEQLARRGGHEVIRFKAIGGEELSHQMYRAVAQELDAIRQRQPGVFSRRRRMKNLKEILGDMIGTRETARHATDLGLGRYLPIRAGWTRSHDRQVQLPKSRLNDLADTLGELAAARGKAATIIIDDLHTVSQTDLAWVNELARHLEKSQGNVHLATAGRKQVIGQLMTATGGPSEVQHDPTRLFEVRECRPAAEEFLPNALHQQWQRSGVQLDPAAAEELLDAANGNLQRLEDFRRAALENGFLQPMPPGYPGHLLDPQSARAAIEHVHRIREPFYEHAWKNGSEAEREVLAQVAGKGQRGLDISDLYASADQHGGEQADPVQQQQKAAELNQARQQLVDNGWIQQSDAGRIRFADPGMQDWVTNEVATHAPYLSQGQYLSQQQRAALLSRPSMGAPAPALPDRPDLAVVNGQAPPGRHARPVRTPGTGR